MYWGYFIPLSCCHKPRHINHKHPACHLPRAYLKKSFLQYSLPSREKHFSVKLHLHSQHCTHLTCQALSSTLSRKRSRIGLSQPAQWTMALGWAATPQLKHESELKSTVVQAKHGPIICFFLHRKTDTSSLAGAKKAKRGKKSVLHRIRRKNTQFNQHVTSCRLLWSEESPPLASPNKMLLGQRCHTTTHARLSTIQRTWQRIHCSDAKRKENHTPKGFWKRVCPRILDIQLLRCSGSVSQPVSQSVCMLGCPVSSAVVCVCWDTLALQ